MRPEKIHFFHIPRTGGFSIYKFWGKRKIRKRFGVQLSNNGHTSYRPYNCPTFTFIRDPIEHARSLYAYIKTHPGMPMHKKVKGLNFSQWIRNRPDHLSKGRPGSFAAFLSGTKRQDPEKELELALKAIDQITFIGFTDNLAQDMNIILRDIAKVDLRWDKTQVNSSARAKPKVSKADKGYIKEVRAADYVLIKHARARRAKSQAGR
jgi:hypothetical protein